MNRKLRAACEEPELEQVEDLFEEEKGEQKAVAGDEHSDDMVNLMGLDEIDEANLPQANDQNFAVTLNVDLLTDKRRRPEPRVDPQATIMVQVQPKEQVTPGLVYTFYDQGKKQKKSEDETMTNNGDEECYK